MKIFQFSDIHGTIEGLEKISSDIKLADLIILSGDITHFGHKEEAITIISYYEKLNKNILAITGNCDYPDVLDVLIDKEYNIEGKLKPVKNYYFIGLGGSLITPFNTPNEYSEDYYEAQLKKISNSINSRPVIIVSHQPPFKTSLDKVMVFKHIGSKALRKFIEENQPILCLCGHIHEAIGIDKIGKTKIVNSGSFRAGKYAEINIENDIIIELKTI
jgi:hypothetical protein